jgi:hypothetical protein
VELDGYNPYIKASDQERFRISYPLVQTSWNNITTIIGQPCPIVLLINFRIKDGKLVLDTAQFLQSLDSGGGLAIEVKGRSPEWLSENARALGDLLNLLKGDKDFPWENIYAKPDPNTQPRPIYDSTGRIESLRYPDGKTLSLKLEQEP